MQKGRAPPHLAKRAGPRPTSWGDVADQGNREAPVWTEPRPERRTLNGELKTCHYKLRFYNSVTYDSSHGKFGPSKLNLRWHNPISCYCGQQ
jgi:hypothetical protein